MVQMAASLGLDSCETNPVLLRKMARWKQDKHRQRVQEARTKKKGADGRSAAPSKKVGVPFGRSGFKQDKPQPHPLSRSLGVNAMIPSLFHAIIQSHSSSGLATPTTKSSYCLISSWDTSR